MGGGAKEDERGKKNWPTRLAGSRRQTSQAEIERKRSAKAKGGLRGSASCSEQRCALCHDHLARDAHTFVCITQSETERDGAVCDLGGEKKISQATADSAFLPRIQIASAIQSCAESQFVFGLL
ncbi:MAG: hypothetical protein V4441_06680 [Pseudomonadota bacterium]